MSYNSKECQVLFRAILSLRLYVNAIGSFKFRIHCCRGYDPESKGKVEAGVTDVKENCLYGESFADAAALDEHIVGWLETVANVRTTARRIANRPCITKVKNWRI